MEQEIKQAVRNLNIAYILFWLLPALLLGAVEWGPMPTGLWADSGQTVYLLETVGILLTILCVPLSLKLFALVQKRTDRQSIATALRRYVQWSIVRLSILEVAVVANIFFYYQTLSSTGHLCMLIGLTASLFCLPGEEKLRRDLRIEKEQTA